MYSIPSILQSVRGEIWTPKTLCLRQVCIPFHHTDIIKAPPVSLHTDGVSFQGYHTKRLSWNANAGRSDTSTTICMQHNQSLFQIEAQEVIFTVAVQIVHSETCHFRHLLSNKIPAQQPVFRLTFVWCYLHYSTAIWKCQVNRRYIFWRSSCGLQ